MRWTNGKALALLAVALPALAGCGDDKSTTTATTSAAAVNCPAEGASSFDANELVGMTPAAAEEKAKGHGCTVRVTRQDGKDLPATLDHRPDRVNVAVENGKVTEVINV